MQLKGCFMFGKENLLVACLSVPEIIYKVWILKGGIGQQFQFISSKCSYLVLNLHLSLSGSGSNG